MIRRPSEFRLTDETMEEHLAPPVPPRLPSECPACYGAHIPVCVRCGASGRPGSCRVGFPGFHNHCSLCVYELGGEVAVARRMKEAA